MSDVAQLEQPYDVVIVGGGPAGASVAIHMAKYGRKTLIVEKSGFPRYHIGESLSGEAGQILRSMGLEDYMKRQGFPVKTGVSVSGQIKSSKIYVPVQQVTSKGAVEPTSTWQVRRAEFDKKLLDTAIERGAVHMNAQALNVIKSDGRVTGVRVKTEKGEKIVIPAKILVDASGQGCFLARQKLLGQNIPTGYEKQIAFFAYAKKVIRDKQYNPDDAHIFYGKKDQWGWLIPVDEEVTSLGIVVPNQMFKESGKNPEAFYHCAIEQINQAFSDSLAPAEFVSDVRVIKNYSYQYEKVSGPGFVSIGDSHAFIDPIFSFGINFALKEGLLAAPEINAYLDDEAHDFASYEDRISKAHELARLTIDTFWNYPLAFLRLAHYSHKNDIAHLFSGRFFDQKAQDLEAVKLMRTLFKNQGQYQTQTTANAS